MIHDLGREIVVMTMICKKHYKYVQNNGHINKTNMFIHINYVYKLDINIKHQLEW